MTAYCCPTCGHSLQGQVATFEVRQRIALHRQAHERVERRRAQWREAKRRQRHGGREVIGYLHSLSCRERIVHRGRTRCVPIPVYNQPLEEAPAARMSDVGVSGESDRITRGAVSELTPLAPRRSSSGVRR